MANSFSFYGGQQGKNFKISKIFPNKEEMRKDLIQRWQSPIGVSELVFISYGIPNDDEGSYITNRDVDLNTYNKTYNSTLWQKIYTEEKYKDTDELTGVEVFYVSEDYGYGYRLLASLTGNTPKLGHITEVLDADQEPRIESDYSDLDNPVFTFYLPQSQVLKTEIILSVLNADRDPKVKFEDNEDPHDAVNHPQLHFSLPQSQVLKEPTVVVEDANYQPSVNDIGDVNEPQYEFHLPQSQVMQQPTISTLSPDAEPQVEDIGGVNDPKLHFSLPRAIKFMYGVLLGGSSEGTYTLQKDQVPGLETGDYYVNKSTGFVYLITDSDDSTLIATFQARLSAPIPSVNTSSSSPFVQDDVGSYSRNTSKVVSSYSNPDEETGWVLTFTIPNLPNFTVGVDYIGAAEEGSAEGTITDTDTFDYHFMIPRGSRFFCGSDVMGESSAFSVEDALNGDYYINTNFGHDNDGWVYQYDGSQWTHIGSIKGNVGNALNIVATYTITPELEIENNLNAVSAYIEEQYQDTIDSTMIFAVNYQEESDVLSYWYYQVNGAWERASLTGGIGNLLIGEYDGTGINDSQGYSVRYIDTLLSNDEVTDATEKKRRGYSVEFIDKLFDDAKKLIINDIEQATSENVLSAEYVNTLIDKAKEDAIDNAKLYWNELGSGAKTEFTVSKGNAENLPEQITAGSVYFSEDEKILYIDIDNENRVKVNAHGASVYLSEDGSEIPLSEFVQKKDIIDTAHGGTGLSAIPRGVLYGDTDGNLKSVTNATGALFAARAGELQYGNLPITSGGTGAASAADARSNLQVYSKTEIDDNATSVAYETTLTAVGWTDGTDKGFEFNYTNNRLKCGKSGNVPPVVTFKTNQDEYNYIDSAEATAGAGIIFYASQKPTEDIQIIVIDVK